MAANYGGKVNNTSSYVRGFIPGLTGNLWKIQNSHVDNINVLTPNSSNYDSVYVPGNLYVDGSIINPSDLNLKQNIEVINPLLTNKLLELNPAKYTLKKDETNKIHYGFIAQDIEQIFPELVEKKPIGLTHSDTYIKAVNYIEIIPLLVSKIKMIEEELKILRQK